MRIYIFCLFLFGQLAVFAGHFKEEVIIKTLLPVKALYQDGIAYCEITRLLKKPGIPVVSSEQFESYKELFRRCESVERVTVRAYKKNIQDYIEVDAARALAAFLVAVEIGLPWAVRHAANILVSLPEDAQFSTHLGSVAFGPSTSFKTFFAEELYAAVKKEMNLIVKESTIKEFLHLKNKITPEVFDVLVEQVLIFSVSPIGKRLLGERFSVDILGLVAHNKWFPCLWRTRMLVNKLQLWDKQQPNQPQAFVILAAREHCSKHLFEGLATLSDIGLRHVSQSAHYGNGLVAAILYNPHFSLATKSELFSYLLLHGSSLNQVKKLQGKNGGSAYHKLCRLITVPGGSQERQVVRLLRLDMPSKKTLRMHDAHGRSLYDYVRFRSLKQIERVLQENNLS